MYNITLVFGKCFETGIFLFLDKVLHFFEEELIHSSPNIIFSKSTAINLFDEKGLLCGFSQLLV